MRTAHGRYLGALAALIIAGAAMPADAGERQNFLVTLEGTFAEFVMYCRVVDGNSVRTVRYSELMPNSYRISADALSCTVTIPGHSGQISGKLYENGKLIADADEKAVRPILKLRSGGPWGKAKAARASVPVRLIRRPAEPQKRPATAEPRDLLPRQGR